GAFATSAGSFTLVLNAPTIANISPNPIAAALATPFTITGTGFGPVGGPVTVRFTGDNDALLWKDGTKNYVDVVGTVVDASTINVPGLVGGAGPAQTLTLTTPLAAVCGVASRGASLRVISPYGSSCVQTATGFVTFAAPTITGVQAPVPGAIATALTITGTNF